MAATAQPQASYSASLQPLCSHKNCTGSAALCDPKRHTWPYKTGTDRPAPENNEHKEHFQECDTSLPDQSSPQTWQLAAQSLGTSREAPTKLCCSPLALSVR